MDTAFVAYALSGKSLYEAMLYYRGASQLPISSISENELREVTISKWTDLYNQDAPVGQFVTNESSALDSEISFNTVEEWATSYADLVLEGIETIDQNLYSELMENADKVISSAIIFCDALAPLAYFSRSIGDSYDSWFNTWASALITDVIQTYEAKSILDPDVPAIIDIPQSQTYESAAFNITRNTTLLYDGALIHRIVAYEIFRTYQLDNVIYCISIHLGGDFDTQYKVYEDPMGRGEWNYPENTQSNTMVFYINDGGFRTVTLYLNTSVLRTQRDSDIDFILSRSLLPIQRGTNIIVKQSISISAPLQNDTSPMLLYGTEFDPLLNPIIGFIDTISSFKRIAPSMRDMLIFYNRYSPEYNSANDIKKLNISIGSIAHNGDIYPSLVVLGLDLSFSQCKFVRSMIGKIITRFGSSPLVKEFNISKLIQKKTTLSNFDERFDTDYRLTCGGQTQMVKVVNKSEYDKLNNNRKTTIKDVTTNNTVYVACDNQYVVRMRTKIGTDFEVPCCESINARKSKSFSNLTNELKDGQNGYTKNLDVLFGVPLNNEGNSYIRRIGITATDNLRLIASIERATKINVMNVISNMTDSDICPFLQSMWYTNKIKQYFNSTRLIDSDDVIDGLSQLLKINIFVFHTTDMVTRMPKYKFIYYSSFYIDRPSICLYRYETTRVLYEPIVILNEAASTNPIYPRGDVYIFPVEITRKLIDLFSTQHRTGLVSVSDGTYTSIVDPAPYFAGHQYEPKGIQIIDGFGKRRGYMNNGVPIYYSSPIAPLTGPYIMYVERNVYDITVGEQELVSPTRLGNKIDLDPVLDIEAQTLENLPVTITYPQTGDLTELTYQNYNYADFDIVRHHRNMVHLRNIVIQLVYWIRMCEVVEGIKDRDGIFNKIVVIKTNYDFDALSPILGPSSSEDAYEWLSRYGFVIDGKFAVSSQHIKSSLQYMLKTESLTRQSVVVPEYLIGTIDYEQVNTIDNRDFVIKFLGGVQSFRSWVRGLPYKNNQLMSSDLKLNSIRLSQQPFTLITQTKNKTEKWIVQNVMNGSYERAINCVVTWAKRKTADLDKQNLGYLSPLIHDDVVKEAMKYIVVYIWQESGIFDTLPQYPKGNYYSILLYPGYTRVPIEANNTKIEGFFAALLPTV